MGIVDARKALPAWPPKGCKGRVSCTKCPKFHCRKCKKKRPWCVGAGDAHPDWCDPCWLRKHPTGDDCPTCKAHDYRLALAAQRRQRLAAALSRIGITTWPKEDRRRY